MFGSIGGPELALIALAIILVFGVGRFSRLGRDLGTSIREFRRAVREDDEEKKQETTSQTTTQANPSPPPAATQPPAGSAPSQGQPSSTSDSGKPNVF